jgi:fluoroquinolone resistance protein
MERQTDEDRIFNSIGPDQLNGVNRSFEGCTFINCDLGYMECSGHLFIDCVFDECNLSLIKVVNTAFQNVQFRNCKVAGVNFSVCKDFSLSFSFSGCMLDYTVFQKKKLKNTVFENCSLQEADFTAADLTNAVFRDCNLGRTVFQHTILKGADFTTAVYFNIDPESNSMAKAKFSPEGLPGLLMKYGLIIK